MRHDGPWSLTAFVVAVVVVAVVVALAILTIARWADRLAS